MSLSHQWQKPERSGDSGACAEIRRVDGMIEVRNDRRPDAGTVVFDAAEWAALIGSIKDGQFDL